LIEKYLKPMKIASFDVFDTVLLRVVGDPKAIFLLLGKKLVRQALVACSPEVFAYNRIKAELRAFKNIGEKYSLHSIYSELATALQLTPKHLEKIMQLELDLESKLLCPVPVAREIIKTARDNGDLVAFISDMYLSSEFIQEQLIRHSFWNEGDVLYVSNEYGELKSTGRLFQELSIRVGISSDRISHWGNDLRVDVQGAKKAGIRAQHFQEGNLNRYEQILESYSYATEGLSSVMAGASKLVRLQLPAHNSHQMALRDVAAGVVAPILVGYVLWLLQQARQMDLKRLYFVSWDGQILLEIARRLIGKLDNIDCELRYIYGSRLSWNLPALVSLNEDQALQMLKRPSWLLDAISTLSLRNFWARVNIGPKEIEDSLFSMGFKKEDWEQTLSPKAQQALHPLLEDRKINDLIFQKATQQRKILMNYLNQEKLLDVIPQGVVDLGWFGSSYDSLHPILELKGATLDVGLFFGLRSRSQEHQSSSKKGYFFDEQLQTGFALALPELGIVPLEMFCTADHGKVVGFVEKNGQACPQFKEGRNQGAIAWGLPLVRDAVYNFTENLMLDIGMFNPYADVREASVEILNSFCLTPTEVEAVSWGDFPWEKGHSEKTDFLAEPYSCLHVAKSFLTVRLAAHQGVWTKGLIARSSQTIQKAIKGFLLYRSLLNVIKSKIRINSIFLYLIISSNCSDS
jgi:FMN phosphatase YigB (HAD superfamily)